VCVCVCVCARARTVVVDARNALVGVRYNANTQTIKMAADRRPNKADNKHVLIRTSVCLVRAVVCLTSVHAAETLRALLSEAFLADSNYIAPLNDESAPGALAAAYEARFLGMLAAAGVQIAGKRGARAEIDSLLSDVRLWQIRCDWDPHLRRRVL
jgi:hypothetical protein